MINTVLFILVLVSLGSPQSNVSPIDFNTPQSCSHDAQYFYPGNLSCISCPPNSITSSNGLSCNCVTGYRQTSNIGPVTCEACPSLSSVRSDDGLYCLTCLAPLIYTGGTCTGCEDQTSIFVDTIPINRSSTGDRRCQTCPASTIADSNKKLCISCGISNCSNCLSFTNGVCFTQPLTPPTSTSFPFYSNFSSSLALCNNGSLSACQLLINLCVLQGYSITDQACQEIRRLSSTLPDLVPEVYFAQFGAQQYLANTAINTVFSTSSSSILPIYAARFALNGTFLDLSLINDTIMLCKDRPSKMATAWQVGVHYEIQCSLDPIALMTDGSSPIFYDICILKDSSYTQLHLVYALEDIKDGNMLVPIPVLISGYRDNNGLLVNEGDDSSQWQFVRRFYTHQSVTGTPSYLEYTEINIQLTSRGHIQSPYLRLSYQTIPTNDAQASFVVRYSGGNNAFNIALLVIASVFVILAVVYAGLKGNGFMRRSGNSCCEFQTFIYLVVVLCSVFSFSFLFLVSISSIFWLLFYKLQVILLLTLPLTFQESTFIVLLTLATLFRFVQIVYLIWKQTSIGIFLIDWEKPKGTGQSKDTPTTTPITSTVSIWRTYFVANEWNEIQTHRKINSFFVLMLSLLFLEIIGLGNFAERNPSIHVTTPTERYTAPHSSVLRIGLAVIVYLLIAWISRMYTLMIHERYIENKLLQLVDLCSISNISIYILSESLYGHYIHGRSVHGKADTNMKEMNENLIKEKVDMCSKRGLLPDTDEQTFEISISQSFHKQFYKILSQLEAERIENQSNSAAISEASVKAHEEMTSFLSSFIDHNLPSTDYVFRKKWLLEKVLGMEFNDAVDRSIFYTNSGLSFSDVLFYNHEWELLSFELLVFLLVDLLSHNYTLAAIVTFTLSKAVSLIRDGLGKRNLGKKTLIDSRFLI